MRISWKIAARFATAAVALFLIVAWVAAHQRADRYAERIRTGLEAALGRRVEFREVHFSLLTGPGFSASDVIIHEDPAIGLEPFIYVASLNASLRVAPLLVGRMEFSSLSLEDTSVNLARNAREDHSRWNFAPLLRRPVNPAVLGRLPEIHVRSGRLNFKHGDSKSVFYFTDTDLDISPPARRGGNWNVRLSGEPARTDRPVRGGFGILRASGRWQQTGEGGRLTMDVRMERSAIGEIVTLLYGRDAGIHGFASARAHIEGPPDNLRISGSLGLEEVHRWDLMPPQGQAWTLAYLGRFSLASQTLDLDSHTVSKEAPPLSVRLRVADCLTTPRYGVGLTWNRFAVEPLLDVARHMGVPLPPDWKMTGTLDGALGYSGSLEGQLAFHDAALTAPGSPPVSFEQASLLFDSGHVHLAPAAAMTATHDTARVEADYAIGEQALDLRISTGSMNAGSLRAQVALAAVPLLEQLQSGTWSGELWYRQKPGQIGNGWSGSVQLRDANVVLPGLAEVCALDSADADIEDARVVMQHIRARVGGVAFQGEYRYEPRLPRPHHFRLSIPVVDSAELERILMPTLRRGNLLARALSFTAAPPPDWLRARHMDGVLQFGTLTIAQWAVSRLRSRVVWDGTHIELADLQGRFENGSMTGRLSVDVRGDNPAYRLAARVKSTDWNGGKVDAEALIETSGIGRALLAHLHSEGSFSGQGFAFAPLDQFRSISGCYNFDWADPDPRWRFTDVQLATGTEIFTGRGATAAGGRLLVEVSSGSRRLNVTGTLAQLRLNESP